MVRPRWEAVCALGEHSEKVLHKVNKGRSCFIGHFCYLISENGKRVVNYEENLLEMKIKNVYRFVSKILIAHSCRHVGHQGKCKTL
mgnify:CR=1 FL=1